MADINDIKLLITAGGTGGHIWPALSFGRWIKKFHPECRIQFVCGSRPLEQEIYKAAGEDVSVLPAEGSPLSGSGMGQRMSRFCSMFSSYSKARGLLQSFRPDAALLFGGYISFPMIAACKRSGVRCAMHEQNARAGKVTRLASSMGTDVFSGWIECQPLKPARFLRTGVPVRDFAMRSKEEAWKALGLPGNCPTGPTAVVFTGSLGSRSIKEKICAAAADERFKDWTFLLPAVSDKTTHASENVWLMPKVWDAALLYSAADILVLRAGGSTLTEAGVLGIPALVIPWRAAADDHQYHNALSFISENIGMIFNEEESAEKLAESLKELFTIREKQRRGGSLKGQGDVICENLWSALFPALPER